MQKNYLTKSFFVKVRFLYMANVPHLNWANLPRPYVLRKNRFILELITDILKYYILK